MAPGPMVAWWGGAQAALPRVPVAGLTDVASNMEFTEYDADELYIRREGAR
jgi:hypothetical protein